MFDLKHFVVKQKHNSRINVSEFWYKILYVKLQNKAFALYLIFQRSNNFIED